jgi:hypothetical protein
MYRKIIAQFLYCYNIFTVAECLLTRVPVNTTVLFPGDYLRLNCSSSVNSVGWTLTKPGSTDIISVSADRKVDSQLEALYKIDNTSLFDLLALQPANATYCGTYTCTDAIGSTLEAEASVSYGGMPLCTVNTTTATSDGLVQFNCTVEICGTVTSQLGIFINGSALLNTTNNFATIVKSGSSVIGSEVKCVVSFGSLRNFTTVCQQIQPPAASTSATVTTLVSVSSAVITVTSSYATAAAATTSSASSVGTMSSTAAATASTEGSSPSAQSIAIAVSASVGSVVVIAIVGTVIYLCIANQTAGAAGPAAAAATAAVSTKPPHPQKSPYLQKYSTWRYGISEPRNIGYYVPRRPYSMPGYLDPGNVPVNVYLRGSVDPYVAKIYSHTNAY